MQCDITGLENTDLLTCSVRQVAKKFFSDITGKLSLYL